MKSSQCVFLVSAVEVTQKILWSSLLSLLRLTTLSLSAGPMFSTGTETLYAKDGNILFSFDESFYISFIKPLASSCQRLLKTYSNESLC